MPDRHELIDRRSFPRLQAPLYSRPAPLQFGSTRQVLDVSRSGARIYSDEFHAEGSQLELELFLAGADSLECKARVVWTAKLPPGSVARYEVGLAFLDAPPAMWSRLQPLLVPDDEREAPEARASTPRGVPGPSRLSALLGSD